jgi:general secretion pathway protein G
MKNMKYKHGFTLIELLVVIVIIGVLMGILLVSYQGTRVTARDGKRKADLEQIRSALELYHLDCGYYPTSISSTGGSLSASCTGSTSVTYMSQVPQDPLPTIYKYLYQHEDNHHYDLYAYLEGGGTTITTKDCNQPGGETKKCNYQVWEP